LCKRRTIQTENCRIEDEYTSNSFMSKLLDVRSRAKKLGLESEHDIKRQKTNEKLAKRLIKMVARNICYLAKL
jgi:hypothetical protein